MPVAVTKPDYYAVLELENGATDDDIRVAYKKLALKWHPDRHQENKEEAQEKFVEVKDAYLYLLEESRRRNKRKTRKTKSESSEPSTSTAPTASSTSSTSSEDSKARSTSEKPHRDTHKHKEHHTEDGSHRPPDPPPSGSGRKPRKLSKQAPPRSDRHGSSSRQKSEHDDSSDDESYTSKTKKPRRSKSGGHESDFEFVEFADLGTPLPPLCSPKVHDKGPHSDKDWIFPLPLTLDELYRGASQTYRITRTLQSGRTQSVKLELKVSPSWQDGARIRVPGVGNEQADGSFQDIVFVVEEQPHAVFTRVGADVHVSVQVPWAETPSRPYSSSSDCTEDEAEAFGEEMVYVKALGGREYEVPIPHSLVEAADGTRIVGAGMPIRKHGKILGKGDLVIKWEFAFADADKGQRHRWQALKKAMHWKL